MLTDDPGTVADGNWEVNAAVLTDRASGTTLYEAPLIDINYGLGDHLQLKLEMPWLVERGSAGPHDGAGNGLLGVKWRFFDEGETGWHFSTYPQLEFGFPLSGSSHHRLGNPGTNLLVPFEVQYTAGDFELGAELGRWLRERPAADSRIAGLVLGHQFSPSLEVLAELHDESALSGARDQLTLNLGLRWNFSLQYSLLVSAGRDLHDSLGPASRLISYLGIQCRY
jgi:hypothetical protein